MSNCGCCNGSGKSRDFGGRPIDCPCCGGSGEA